MNTQDRKKFRQLIETIYEVYQKDPPSTALLTVWWDDLSAFPFEAVSWAWDKHRKGPRGQYLPRVADLLKALGVGLDGDDLLAMADNPSTVAGWLLLRAAGSYDIHVNRLLAKSRVERYYTGGGLARDLDRISRGQLTEHERHRLKLNNISPQSMGLPDPVISQMIESTSPKGSVPALAILAKHGGPDYG